jgi:hypothetical protein|tara:strand:- start:23943 stop:24530 length:588 start_codon:yes stop_codon:yes gene_type:complete
MPHQDLQRIGPGVAVQLKGYDRFQGFQPLVSIFDLDECRVVYGGMPSRGGPPDSMESKGTVWKLKSVSQPPVLMPEDLNSWRNPGSATTSGPFTLLPSATESCRTTPFPSGGALLATSAGGAFVAVAVTVASDASVASGASVGAEVAGCAATVGETGFAWDAGGEVGVLSPPQAANIKTKTVDMIPNVQLRFNFI